VAGSAALAKKSTKDYAMRSTPGHQGLGWADPGRVQPNYYRLSPAQPSPAYQITWLTFK
jgi:hypothetical protein